MSSAPPHHDQDADPLPGKLAELLDMGFERVEAPPVTTESVRLDKCTHKLSQFRPAMGTFISVSVLHESEAQAEEAIGRSFEEMERLVDVFNRWDHTTALAQLNERGVLRDAPPELVQVVSESLRYGQKSAGAFDVSVKPLVDIFIERLAEGETSPPDRAEVREALELVGSQNIAVDEGTIVFERSGMGITLDGIAKGHIVDRVGSVLQNQGITSYLINAGGDIRSAGTKENRLPWTVAVQDPLKRDNFPDVIELGDGAVATSGSYEIYFDRERLHHHVVSSRSGVSPRQSTSVSVMAPTTMAADALATAVFVMRPEAALGFVNSLPHCECLIIDAAGIQQRSRGWKSAKPMPS